MPFVKLQSTKMVCPYVEFVKLQSTKMVCPYVDGKSIESIIRSWFACDREPGTRMKSFINLAGSRCFLWFDWIDQSDCIKR